MKWLLNIAAVIAIGSMVAEAQDQVELPIQIAPAEPNPVSTQDIESGKIQLPFVGSPALEATLRDLNRRKDYDASCHGGQAGPDGAYLALWAQRVTDELVSRGYYFDSADQFHQPGVLVPVR